MSKETKFEWNDELVKEILSLYIPDKSKDTFQYDFVIGGFKISKQSKEKELNKGSEKAVKVTNFSFESNSNLLKVFINGDVNEVVGKMSIDKLMDGFNKVLNGELDTKPQEDAMGLKTGVMSQTDMYWMGYKDATKHGNPPQTFSETLTNTVTDNSDVICLSLNDLLDVWDMDGMPFSKQVYKSSKLYKNFEQKVKQKLNQ